MDMFSERLSGWFSFKRRAPARQWRTPNVWVRGR